MEPEFIVVLVLGIIFLLFWVAVAINQWLSWELQGKKTLDMSPVPIDSNL